MSEYALSFEDVDRRLYQLLRHDFGSTQLRMPLMRHHTNEPDQLAHLRGIVWVLESSRRNPPRPGKYSQEYDRAA